MADHQEVTDDSLFVCGGSPRRRGRPPVPDRGERVSFRIPESSYDRIAKIAHRHGISMSEAVRKMVLLQLHKI